MRNRYQGSAKFKCNLGLWSVTACDNIEVTFPFFELANSVFEVQHFQFGLTSDPGNPDQPPVPSCLLTLQATDSSVYDWSTSEELGLTITPSPTISDAFQVSAPTDLVLQSGNTYSYTNDAGVVIGQIRASWTPPADTFITQSGYEEVQWSPAGANEWSSSGLISGTSTFYTIAPVVGGSNYDVRVRGIRNTGVTTELVQVSAYTVSTTTSTIDSQDVYYQDGTPIENLKPSQIGADQTGMNNSGGVIGHVITFTANTYSVVDGFVSTDIIDDSANGALYTNAVHMTSGSSAQTPLGSARGFAPGQYSVYLNVRTDGAGSNPTTLPCGFYNNSKKTYQLNAGLSGLTTSYQTIFMGVLTIGADELTPETCWTTFFSAAGYTTNYYIDFQKFTPMVDYDNQITDGVVYHRVPAENLDANRRALIDFTQAGHIGKTASNIPYEDGSSVQSLQPSQAGADQTASASKVVIQNPNFAQGSIGWVLPAGASIEKSGSGSGYTQVLALTNTDDSSSYDKPPCMLPSCNPGGVDAPASQSYVISAVSSPAPTSDSKMVTGTVTTNATSTQTNVLWSKIHGSNDDVTKLVHEWWFNVGATLGNAYEFDMQVFDKSRGLALVWGLQVLANGQWQTGTFSGPWQNTPSNVPLLSLSPGTWHHIIHTGHRVLGDTSGPDGMPYTVHDSLYVDGVTYPLSVSMRSYALPAGWNGILSDQNQIDVGSTSGTAKTVTCQYTGNNFTAYTGEASETTSGGNVGNLVSYNFDNGSTAGLTATGSPAIDSTKSFSSPNSVTFPAGVNSYQTTAFAGQNSIYTRQYIYIDTLGSTGCGFLGYFAGTALLGTVYFNSNGSMGFYNNQTSSGTTVTTNVMSTGAWHLVETYFAIGASTGQLTVKIDGTQVYNGTSLNLGTAQVTAIQFGNISNGTGWVTNEDNVDVSSTAWIGPVTAVPAGIPAAAISGSDSVLTIDSNIEVDNLQQIPCAAGAVLSTAAYASGSGTTNGYASIAITFYSASATLLRSDKSNSVSTANGDWYQMRVVSSPAPAGTAFAVVSASVSGLSAGEWYFSGFSGSLQPNSLDEVPDGQQYARPSAIYVQNGVPDTYMGAWSSSTSYLAGEEVAYSGNYWSCLRSNSNSAPSAGNANWILVGPATLDAVSNGSTYKKTNGTYVDNNGDITGFQGQGTLATIDQANAVNIAAHAVNASILFQSTVLVDCAADSTTVIAQSTIATGGGFCTIRFVGYLFNQGGAATYPKMYLYKGDQSGTQLQFLGNFYVPAQQLAAMPVVLEWMDALPAASQEHTVVCVTDSQALQFNPITMTVQNMKV